VRNKQQKGMAVIGALIVVAAASAATASIMERQSMLADTLMGERDRVQAKWLLRGGLDWARIILLNDARNNAVTLRTAIWSQPIAGLEISTPDGQRRAIFSGLIEDEQGKFNLARLATGGVVQPNELAALQNLLSSLGVAASLAPAIAQRVARSQPGSGQPATAPALRSIDDLQGMEHIGLDTVATLSSYLTVLPRTVALNVNTASAEVLSAVLPDLDLATARSLTQQRDQGLWFNSRGDFLNRLDNPQKAVSVALDVRSEWFKVHGEVELDHARVGMTALLHRQGNAPPTVSWTRA